jgi:hypothetical protein
MAAKQVPAPGEITLDHVAHFVPDIDRAGRALERLGFTLTPFSAQSHRTDPTGPLIPAGTGNRCVMLESGYLEFLTPTGDTALAAQLRGAIERYVGVHLIAFGTAAPETDHARLSQAGFEPLHPVDLQRDIDSAAGSSVARFTVVRVPPGRMAEGRIQFCRHHTPELLWQTRWMQHPNGATALTGALICVEDPEGTARRYSRFTGLAPHCAGSCWRIDTSRGFLLFVPPDAIRRRFGITPPALPWIAGYTLACESVPSARSQLSSAEFEVRSLDSWRFFVVLPLELGGLAIFEPSDSPRLSLD